MLTREDHLVTLSYVAKYSLKLVVWMVVVRGYCDQRQADQYVCTFARFVTGLILPTSPIFPQLTRDLDSHVAVLGLLPSLLSSTMAPSTALITEPEPGKSHLINFFPSWTNSNHE